MSSALAIAGVTATLEFFLNAVLNNPSSVLGTVTVSALAPDILQTTVAGSSKLYVNLFLHQVAHNPAWRNIGFPSLSADGSTLLQNPPLALDLHYLLTVYASEDTQAEALLGYAILMLHENAILPRAQIRTALISLPSTNPFSTNPLSNPLSTSGLADQIEMIKITPATLGREEMAWIWTALKADYRPTYAFQASVVLIQPQLPTSVALPVLSTNISAQAVSPAQIVDIQPPNNQLVAAPGDIVTVTGQFLSGPSQISLTNARLGIQRPPFAPTTVTNSALAFVVPDDAVNLPAGVYNLTVLFISGSTVVNSTNSLPIGLAPSILSSPAPAATSNASGTLVTLTCKPQVRPNQTVTLILGSQSAQATQFESATAVLSFQFPALASGSYLARLRVDGVESPVGVNWKATPPAFTGPFITI
ncbi:MAG: DUF4255 domain-containing protein [Silvibacterium sp.]|nr:DUF4255 domain-containing protein [Silvibacterium sp.]